MENSLILVFDSKHLEANFAHEQILLFFLWDLKLQSPNQLPKLHQKYLPKIVAAQLNQDFNAYYLTLRAYLNEIPDGHVRMDNLKAIDDLVIGGGYGLALADTSDGKVTVSWVDQSSPAWEAGMRPGDTLISWNGQPIKEALEQASTLVAGTSATTEYLQLKQAADLVRGPIGQPVEVGYQAPDSGHTETADLVAYDDGGLSLRKNYPDAVVSNKLRDMFVGVDNPDPVPDALVESKMVADKISYLKILGELDADLHETGNLQSTVELVKNAISAAQQNGAQGMILDLRNNIGGLDQTLGVLGREHAERQRDRRTIDQGRGGLGSELEVRLQPGPGEGLAGLHPLALVGGLALLEAADRRRHVGERGEIAGGAEHGQQRSGRGLRHGSSPMMEGSIGA